MSSVQEAIPPTGRVVAGAADQAPGVPEDTRPFGTSAAPVLVAAALLLVGAWFEGAFSIRHWGPPAILVLLALAVVQRRPLRGPVLWAFAALWGLAALMLVSAAWAPSPATALEGGARAVLYAGLVTLPVATLAARHATSVAAALTVGLGALVVGIYLGVIFSGTGFFLAGRLDDPVGYRNATAALCMLAFWPLASYAARRSDRVSRRAAAFAIAVLALGLAFLTQSRGPVLALVAGAVVCLALGPDRLRRAWVALAAVALVAAASGPLLAPYEAFRDDLPVTSDQISEAAVALAALLAVAAGGMLLAALFDRGLRAGERARATAHRLAIAGLAVVALGGVAGAAVAVGDPVAFAGDKWDEFRAVDAPVGQRTRLSSVGGQRYDLWRIALIEFGEKPVLGQGEGGYPRRYYEERRTDRNLDDAHGLPFALLAQNGAVGFLLFAGFLVCAGLAIARSRRRLPPAAWAWTTALCGAAAGLLVEASVDWLWLVPGVTGLALFALGVALAAAREDAPPRPGRLAGVATGARAGALLAAAALIAVLFLADVQVRQARAERGGSPREQLDAARSAATLNPWSVRPLYLQAGALEALGRPAEARRKLRDALEREPGNFVTHGLLGDLETRAGQRAVARAHYRRALALNPLDVGLRQLARR